ncbi:sulfate adenylyltransferase subunit CysN [Gammaproteobacteria bacterium]|nr:sulfate adenylyltransferase subunit CysN [Gammaproteobacteria bacterium]
MEILIEQNTSELQKLDIKNSEKPLLRFITCGSVDDGKSTLIGRLLFESNAIYDNELATLHKESEKFGSAGGQTDYSLLVDGLSSEREQGITIDVAYRFFQTESRKYIVADTPGHEQYTRNMATGASTASAAIIIIDATKGVLKQTKRHSTIVSMLGVKHIIVAINKMDLADYSESRYKFIEKEFLDFAKNMDFETINIIPISATYGDNISSPSKKTEWYNQDTLINALEKINTANSATEKPFRFCVQWVNRPNKDFRGYSGTVDSGVVVKGQKIIILPSGIQSQIKRIVTFDGDLTAATEGMAVTLMLNDEIDVSRGDIICDATSACDISSKFQTTILWMSAKPLIAGREYYIKTGANTSIATPTRLKSCININTMKPETTTSLNLNEIGICEISINLKIPFEKYKDSKKLGSFILIDRVNYETVAAGWFNFALRRSKNIHPFLGSVNSKERSKIKSHQPFVLWFTGISGAGKSTIACDLESKLNNIGIHTILLDGDNIRQGLNKDLGFTETDRVENIRRISEVAKLMFDAGLISLVSFISPFAQDRQSAKSLIGNNNFIEIFVDTKLDEVKKRDVKGLYKKAKDGSIKNFTGIDSPYEKPNSPDIHIKTHELPADKASDIIINFLQKRGIIN